MLYKYPELRIYKFRTLTTPSVLSFCRLYSWAHLDSWKFFAAAPADLHICPSVSDYVYSICISYTLVPPPSCTVCDAEFSPTLLSLAHSYDSVWCPLIITPRRRSTLRWFFDNQSSSEVAFVQRPWSYPRCRVDTACPSTRAYHRRETFLCTWGIWIIAPESYSAQTGSA